MTGPPTETTHEESEDCHLNSLERGVDKKHDHAEGIRKTAEHIDRVNEPVEAHEMANEACKPTGEDRLAEILRMVNGPEERHESDPS